MMSQTSGACALVQADRVHRDVYVDPDVFEAERRQFFATTWNFVAHGSQLPNAGDYVTLDLAGRPLLVLRQPSGAIAVFYNRCAHKGTKLVTRPEGNAGRVVRCPYHAWTYRLDGSLLGVPMKPEYEGTALNECETGQGLIRVPGVEAYRDFVFVRLGERGPSFHDYFGPALQWIDNMVDRSPVGKLAVAGGIIRNTIRCNWKMYLENINDTVHPVATHESAGKAAKAVWAAEDKDKPMPMAVEQLLPFASTYEYFDRMDAEVYPHGHSALGVSFSTHSGYAYPPEYEEALARAHGEARAREILGRSPQNSVLFPSIAIKGAPLVMRVIRPLTVDRTIVEAWSFRAEGAPDLLHERAMSYNRLVFSPMSVVAHDDVHLFESIQEALEAEGNPWVSLHRGFQASELSHQAVRSCRGTSELLMRNQFRAWAEHMASAQEP